MRCSFALIISLCVLVGCDSSTEFEMSPEAMQMRIDTLEQELQLARARIEELKEARSGTTIEVLSTDIHFRPGSAQLSPRGADRLDSLAQVIEENYDSRQIRVEGYADDLPIRDSAKDRYFSNWELSAARAAAVVRYFQWGHDMDPSRFEVVGFGSYRPVVPNTSPENRRKNRRVRIAVLPANIES